MGLKDRKKSGSQSQFKPLDLNEETVQSIFKKCLSNGTPQPGVDLCSTLFGVFGGYDKDYQNVHFNIKSIKENKQNIFYLFGQLKAVHEGKKYITPEEGFTKYSNINWTSNNRIIDGTSLFR